MRVSLRGQGWLAFAVLCAGLFLPALGQDRHPITGRRIAPVMGMSGADWLERPERQLEEDPERAIDLIGLKPGMMVGDVGAGVGYFTLRMAKRVAPTGKVYANDVQPGMLRRLRQRAAAEGITNIETILGTETDPRLPANTLDLIIMVDVYHEFSRPQEMLQALKTALKPDGRLILLEYRKEDPSVPIRPEHKMSVAEAKAELEAEGYKLEKVLPDLPRQHILIFKKTPVN